MRNDDEFEKSNNETNMFSEFESTRFDRRQFLIGATAITTGAVGMSTPAVAGCSDDTVSLYEPDPERLVSAFERRTDAATEILDDEIQETGNYARLEDRIGTHSKGLDHDEHGIVTDQAFNALEKAFKTGTREAFEDVPLGGSRQLATPQTALSYNALGADTFSVPIRDPPAFESEAAGSAMVELYWRALARDVPFVEYEDDSLIAAASDEFSEIDDFAGPTDEKHLFRGEYAGVQTGPYISQFLYQSTEYGAVTVDPRVRPFKKDLNHITTFDEWLGISRNGDREPVEPQFEDEKRYITTGRDLFRLVHLNLPGQLFFHTAVIAANEGIPTDDANPFKNSTVQAGFIDIDFPATILRVVQDIAKQVLRPAWYQKWLGHRYARPEEYGGIVELSEGDYNKDYSDVLPDVLLDSEALKRTVDKQGNYLLTSAVPEGSPTHPSYPAGHGAIAGACGTVLKAFFDEDARIENPQRATADGELEAADVDSLRFSDEINKLMTNNALGRDFGGFHYRFNGLAGIKMGETYAISYIADFLSEAFTKPIGPLTFRSINGEEIEISPSVS